MDRTLRCFTFTHKIRRLKENNITAINFHGDNGMKEISFIKRTLQGTAIGLANVVPGVSGGTMALILGIYRRLIHAINTLPLTLPIKFIRGEDVKEDWNDIDFRFLLPLGIGVVIATLLLARVMEFLLETYSTASYSFFIGLILASLFVVYRYIDPTGVREVLSGVIGFLVAFFVVGGNGITGTHNPISIFFGGVFAVASMILPGISGSLVLVLLGEYHYMLHALNTFDIFNIVIFVAGGLVGLFGFAKLLEYMLDRSTSITMAFLFGLMFGGLRVPLKTAMLNDPSLFHIVIPASVGALLLYLMEYHRTKVTSD